MPESSTPLNFSGGKVTGTRMMELKMPLSPRIFQKGLLFCFRVARGLPSGIRYLPTENTREAAAMSAEDRMGA